MADGHVTDVELLRRELAILILEWAGKATKDDPDGPMSTALIRAVGEAARGAVAEQHQALTADAADRIAEALERRRRADGLIIWRMRPWALGLIAVAAAALLVVAFVLGLQSGRTEAVAPAPTSAAASAGAPIAPLAPTVDEAPPSERREPAKPQPQAPAAAKPQRAAPAPAARATPPRELGRPAQAKEAASSSTQPVGATPAQTSPAATTPPPKP